MASKFGLAGGLPERRVRPIWDAIDSRQFKNSLKLCSSLLTKYPNSPYALALKALTLERMGKPDEALSVCLNAKDLLLSNDSVFVDDLTLSTLQIVFQRLDHLDMATCCYEYACGKFMNNLELMMGLFNCYVREYSFVKQQQIAIKMYKVGAEERFLLWAVCSIQLQVLCGNGGEKLLLLAEGLLKKHISSHSLHEPEALIVYMSLLEQQSKYGDALEILSGSLGSLIMIEVDRLRIQGRLLARAGDFAAAADIFRKVLEMCLDDWECFLQYLGCLLEDDSSLCLETNCESFSSVKHLNCNKFHITDEVFDSRISTASGFVQKLLEKTNGDSIRCPHLASLEIERRKVLFGRGDTDKLLEALVQYFLRFGHLACFSSDVEVFLGALSHHHKSKFLENLVKSCGYCTTHMKNLGQFISLFKVRELVDDMFTLPLEDLEGFSVQMADMYCKSLPLSKDLDIQESMHGEELLSMVCNVLVQLFWRTKHLGYLLESIMILEFGLAIRRESADLTFLAYRHRNYSKVIEFVQFKERLQRSNQYLMAKIESPILQLKQSADDIEQEKRVLENLNYGAHFVELSSEIRGKTLTFNEDLKLRPWWTPTCDKNYLLGPFEGVSYYPRENLIKEIEGNVVRTIEKRSLLPRMIYLSIQCAPSTVRENTLVNGSLSKSKVSIELKILLERYAKILGFSFQDAVELLFGVSNCNKPSEVLSSDSTDWINFAVFLNAWNLNSHELETLDGDVSKRSTWHLVNFLLEKYILENLQTMGPLISSPGNDLSLLVQLVSEPLAWHSLVIHSWIRSSHPSGKKKKKGGASEPNTHLCLEMRNSIVCLCSILEELTKWLSEQISEPIDGHLDILLSLFHGKGLTKGPGRVLHILESLLSSTDGIDLGDRITQALQSWSLADVARKLATAQRRTLLEFLRICRLKLKSLQSLKPTQI